MKKTKIQEEIINLIEKAKKSNKRNPELAKKLIKKAKRIAMHSHIKIPEECRDSFCKKCSSIFTDKNRKIRIKKGFKITTCLNCGYIKRKKI